MPNDRRPFRGGSIVIRSDPETDTIIGVVLETPGGYCYKGDMQVTGVRFSREGGRQKTEIVLTGLDFGSDSLIKDQLPR